MYKYKYFLLFFCILAVLFLWNYFPICFDNNDDQTINGICSGMFSGIPSSHLLLSNIITGKFLVFLFSVTKKINWYTLYLQSFLALCFLYLAFLFIKSKNINFFHALLWLTIIFSGFFALAIVKPQFTTIALFGTFVSLFCLAEPDLSNFKKLVCILFLSASLLIRIESFYIFSVFLLPFFFLHRNKKNRIQLGIILIFGLIIFLAFTCINKYNIIYKQQQSYSKLEVLDIIAAKPIKVNEIVLKKYNFSLNDIKLIQSWMLADDYYLSDRNSVALALELKANRNFTQMIYEWKKFVTDERYILGFYFLSFLILVFIIKINTRFIFLNLMVFIVLLFYLTATSRIPHRIMFPILSYLVLINLYFIAQGELKKTTKTVLIIFFTLLSLYKLYCVCQLIPLHKSYHDTYSKTVQKIKEHPEILFIGADGFPLQYMNAWQTTKNNISILNLIPAGWYACSPDYKEIMKIHQLNNLTSDLYSKKNVVFLTESTVLQNAFVKVMKERYNKPCHFEEQLNLAPLKAKKLIFDN